MYVLGIKWSKLFFQLLDSYRRNSNLDPHSGAVSVRACVGVCVRVCVRVSGCLGVFVSGCEGERSFFLNVNILEKN